MNIRLMYDSFTEEELQAVIDCMKSGEYTQGKVVSEFEQKFARWVGSRYAVMVNSGSSANLLMVMLLKEKLGLKDGDEVLVPVVTWPTTVYPLLQHNLVPVFCDVDDSYNISPASIRRMAGSRTKAVFAVHLLGQPAEIFDIVKFCQERNLVLIEDCCESLGAKYLNIHVGNFGVMGSFSFYFGHHMSSIEGGMIITNDEVLCDLLKSARSHGWIRNSLRQDKYKDIHTNLDFIFDMQGYNMRSTNLNAAIALVQLKKLERAIQIRKKNHAHFAGLLATENRVKLQKVNLSETSSFSLGLLFNSQLDRKYVLAHLPENGVECRPIVAGSLIRQPVFEKFEDKYKRDVCSFADTINEQGIYLPNNQFLDEEQIIFMATRIIELLNQRGREVSPHTIGR